MVKTGAVAAVAKEMAFAQSDNLNSPKEVAVCQSNDMLCCCEGFTQDDALHGGIFGIAFKKHDKERDGHHVGRDTGMPLGGEF